MALLLGLSSDDLWESFEKAPLMGPCELCEEEEGHESTCPELHRQRLLRLNMDENLEDKEAFYEGAE
jgi:hypothetical protein